ncbi:MAG TPA: phosphodiester glycosidase family protein, partial [Acidimicrobiales bacterium]|nr:phosphodiester glycosidase family protein [Acidimicrobiales bacterium]
MALRTVAPRRVSAPVAALLGILTLLAGLVPALPAAAAATAPPGWQLVASENLGPGVEHQTLRMANPAEEVHVARLAAGGTGRLLPVLAHDVLTGASSGPERTSAMCARVKCVAAVNGDFFDGAGDPVGAMVSAGELVASPADDHILLRIDAQGRPTLRPGMDWSAAVMTADGRAVAVDAVNRPLTGDGIALYSRRWGPSTGTDPATTEAALQLPPATAVLPSGATPVAIGPAVAGGDLPIGAGQVVLSGRGPGAAAVAQLASHAAVLKVDLGGTAAAIGGSPQLLQGGQIWFPTDNRDDFTQGRHARTMVGLTSNGEMLLVTADGAGPGSGLTLVEAARLMSGLG